MEIDITWNKQKRLLLEKTHIACLPSFFMENQRANFGKIRNIFLITTDAGDRHTFLYLLSGILLDSYNKTSNRLVVKDKFTRKQGCTSRFY